MEQVSPVTCRSTEEICCADTLPANKTIDSIIRLLIVFIRYNLIYYYSKNVGFFAALHIIMTHV
ncbi:hypothetical protein D3C86_2241340 [compost metagenome]